MAGAAASALGLGTGGSDPWQQHVVAITLEAGLAPAVDVLEIVLAAAAQAPAVAVGDGGSVSLGYEDSGPEVVFSGAVEQVSRGIHGATRIVAVNGGARLSHLRLNQSYDGRVAGDIVRDLAGRAEVTAGSVEDGADLPFYVVDDRRTAYQHVAALAQSSGFLVYLSPAGELHYAPFSADEPVQTFTYGVDILELELADTPTLMGTAAVVGEGAAGSQGQSAWSWLVKDSSPVRGEAGSGAPERLLETPALRSAAAARGAAEAQVAAAAQAAVSGRLLVPGAPAVTVGSAVEVSGVPTPALNGLYLVRALRHRFAKSAGFTTLLSISKAGAGGAGDGLGGLL